MILILLCICVYFSLHSSWDFPPFFTIFMPYFMYCFKKNWTYLRIQVLYIHLLFQLCFLILLLHGLKTQPLDFPCWGRNLCLELVLCLHLKESSLLLWPSRVWTLASCETFAVWTSRRGAVLCYCFHEHWKQLTSLLGGDGNLYFPIGLLWPHWHGEVGDLSFPVGIHH